MRDLRFEVALRSTQSDGVPGGAKRGTRLTIKRTIYPVYLRIPDISTASLGARIRYLRKRLGYTITSLATLTELGHNTIAKLERDEMKSIKPWVLGRMLPFLLAKFKEAFPDATGDTYDYLIPPNTFGDWLRNLRLRRGLRQRELAKSIGVNKFTITRYEANQSLPNQEIRRRLQKHFGLSGEFDRFFKPDITV
jgi:transcriptional regulator with XRE-family HTH domain